MQLSKVCKKMKDQHKCQKDIKCFCVKKSSDFVPGGCSKNKNPNLHGRRVVHRQQAQEWRKVEKHLHGLGQTY